MRCRIDKIQVLFKKITKNAVIKALPCLMLGIFSIPSFATDSTGLTASTGTQSTLDYLPNISKVLSIPSWSRSDQFTALNVNGSAGASVNSPLQMLASDGSTSSYTVPYSGYYEFWARITWALTANQAPWPPTLPLNLWVDSWASSPDASGTFHDIRISYTGDTPLQLSNFATGGYGPGSPFWYVFYLYGGAYLNAGATIWLPRVWTDTNNSSNWWVGQSGSSFTITLMSHA
ncbi:MAG: hypothetical protein P4M12_00490 [Gammaproteobacteria bacterium]|nr:hypothetical protein [Gammaproteobacteria bacterium]